MTDTALIRAASQFRRGILGKRSSDRMCFAVCAPLETFLNAWGVASRLVEVDMGHTNHFYLELEDGRILDPTADQFGGPPVFLGVPEVWPIAKATA